MSDVFMIRLKGRDWRVVTKAEYIAAERAAGFYGHGPDPVEPVTSQFTGRALEGLTLFKEVEVPA